MKADWLVCALLFSTAFAPGAPAAPAAEQSPKYQALLHAIIQTDVSGAKKLIDEGLDVNTRVHPAAADAWISDAFHPTDQPLLVVAARFGVPDSPFVAMLLARHATIDVRDSRERTPLMYAAQLGWSPTIEQLLAAHANVNAADADGITVLMHAMGNRNLGTVAKLLDEGARVNAADAQGDTPLMYALRNARQDPIRIYGRKDNPKEAVDRYLELVKYLIARKADVNARNKRGDSVMSIAGAQGEPEVLRVLKQAGAKD